MEEPNGALLYMARDYETEQEQLRQEVAALEEWVEQEEAADDDVDRFIALVEKYEEVTELTPTIVNEYIQKIVVHAPDKSSGKRKQRIQIYFNFLGEFNIHNLNAPIILEMPPYIRHTA
ncbi:MAG: DUF4368 domain-containing protein [Lachnospiraceae bacterium]|nr:DUF4368 domain-containing protein [Lachnospiraceae bacterium]